MEPMVGVVKTTTPITTPPSSTTATQVKSTDNETLKLPSYTFPSHKAAQEYANEYLDIKLARESALFFLGAARDRLELLQEHDRDARARRTTCSQSLPQQVMSSSSWGPITKKAQEHLRASIALEEANCDALTLDSEGFRKDLEEKHEKHRAAQFVLSQKRLPIDVWRLIFLLHHIDSPKMHPSRHPSHVCRFWRAVIISYPALWSSIPIARASPQAAITSMENYLSRVGGSRKITLKLPQTTGFKLHLTGCDYTFSGSMYEYTYEDDVRGIPPAYGMHCFQTAESLVIEATSVDKFPTVTLTHWPLHSLECKYMIPVISPSLASGLTKLTLWLYRWPPSETLETLLQLTTGLQELTLDYGSSVVPALYPQEEEENEEVEDEFILQNLRCLRAPLTVLFKNMDVLGTSPVLEKLSIMVNNKGDTHTVEEWKKVLDAPSTITHLEITTGDKPTATAIQNTFNFLRCLTGIQTLTWQGEWVSTILFDLWGSDGFKLDGITLVFKEWDVKFVLLMQLVGTYSVKKVVLVGCRRITKAQCEKLKEVAELELYY